MNLNPIWSALEESYEVFDKISGSAIVKFAEKMHIQPGWGTWVPAVVLFPSEPISSAQYMKIFPYGLALVIDERFASAAQQGYLISGEGGYRVTEKGKNVSQEGLQVLTNAIAHLRPMPPTEFQRLVDYLVKLSNTSSSAPEPSTKFCITHYKNYKNTFSSDAPLSRLFVHYYKELDFYRTDSHMAAWRIHNIEGNRWEVFSEIWSGKNNTLDKLNEELSFRGIARDEYAQILQELVECDWIQENASEYQLTAEGKHIREEAEALTDHYFFAPWSCLSESQLEDLINLAIQLHEGLSGIKV